MKKEYDTPKAEKLEFDYTSTVVASNGGQQKIPGIEGSVVEYDDMGGTHHSQTYGGDE